MGLIHVPVNPFSDGWIIKLELLLIAGMIDGGCALLASPSFFSVTQDVVLPKLRATAMAFAGIVVFLLGGAWGPVIVGTLSDFFEGKPLDGDWP